MDADVNGDFNFFKNNNNFNEKIRIKVDSHIITNKKLNNFSGLIKNISLRNSNNAKKAYLSSMIKIRELSKNSELIV